MAMEELPYLRRGNKLHNGVLHLCETYDLHIGKLIQLYFETGTVNAPSQLGTPIVVISVVLSKIFWSVLIGTKIVPSS